MKKFKHIVKFILAGMCSTIIILIILIFLHIYQSEWGGALHINIMNTERLFQEAAELPRLFELKENEVIYFGRSSTKSSSFVVYYGRKEAKIPPLPPAISALAPRDVYVSHYLVVLQVRGGGPVGHEGVCIYLDDTRCDIPKTIEKYNLKPLDNQRHIYQYSLYDFRQLYDFCER